MGAAKPTARFIASATGPTALPCHGVSELAFAGRSNVGKSSLMGAVMGNAHLVRASRTPGRTRALNLFAFGDLALVDLPGYGYAKMAASMRASIENMLRAYLARRETLAGVVLLVDARREAVTTLDRAFVEWVLQVDRRLLVVLSKIDLVPKTRRRHVAAVIERGLGLPAGSSLLCSVRTGEGIKELTTCLWQLRGGE